MKKSAAFIATLSIDWLGKTFSVKPFYLKSLSKNPKLFPFLVGI